MPRRPPNSRPPLEKTTERKAVAKIRADGAAVCKLNLLGQRSWPDRLIVPKGVRIKVFVVDNVEDALDWYEYMSHVGEPFLLEFKRRGARLEPLQAELYERLTGEQPPRKFLPRKTREEK